MTNNEVSFGKDFCDIVEVSFNQLRTQTLKKSSDFGFTTIILKALKTLINHQVILIPLSKLINICIKENVYSRLLKNSILQERKF